MARTYAQLHVSLWEDPEFLALGPDARFVYVACFGQKITTYCGTLIYSPARIAHVTGLTVKQVDRAVAELHPRWIYHDQATGEVLCRGFIKVNKVLSQPQLRKGMERTYADILSPQVRRLVEAEVLELMPDYRGPCRPPSAKGAGRPAADPAGQGADQGDGQAAERLRITRVVGTYNSGITPNPEPPASPDAVAPIAAAARASLHGGAA